MNDRRYIERFNQGYGLMKHHPELAKKLRDGLEQKQDLSQQDKALIDGMTELKKELAREAMTERMNDRQNKEQNQKR